MRPKKAQEGAELTWVPQANLGSQDFSALSHQWLNLWGSWEQIINLFLEGWFYFSISMGFLTSGVLEDHSAFNGAGFLSGSGC